MNPRITKANELYIDFGSFKKNALYLILFGKLLLISFNGRVSIKNVKKTISYSRKFSKKHWRSVLEEMKKIGLVHSYNNREVKLNLEVFK